MENIKYTTAMAEVLEYLKGIRKEDLDKIPQNFLSFLEENSSKDYNINIDFNQPLKDLAISSEAKGIISFICYNYWCETESQKKDFYNKLSENEKILPKELQGKYSSENIFSNSSDEKTNSTQDINIATVKKSNFKIFCENLVSFFKKIFKK